MGSLSKHIGAAFLRYSKRFPCPWVTSSGIGSFARNLTLVGLGFLACKNYFWLVPYIYGVHKHIKEIRKLKALEATHNLFDLSYQFT